MKTLTLENYLNKPFLHGSWFTKIDEATGEPETSNKHALMYFASCGDFKLNNDESAIVYTGREGGSCTGAKRVFYFKQLQQRVKKAKEKGKKLAKKYASEYTKENYKFYFEYSGLLICVNFWNKENYFITVHFSEYLEKHCNDYFNTISKQLLKN